jgi:hypothetical protein
MALSARHASKRAALSAAAKAAGLSVPAYLAATPAEVVAALFSPKCAIATTTYCLPAHWAPALFNDDASGLDDQDAAALENLLREEGLAAPLSIVGDDQGQDPFFKTYHDARPYGVLACDCFDYVFPA